MTKFCINLIVLMFIVSCTQVDYRGAEIVKPFLSKSQVVELGYKYMASKGFSRDELIISSGPTIDEDGVWRLIFEETNASLALKTSSYGIFIEDKNPELISLTPGI